MFGVDHRINSRSRPAADSRPADSHPAVDSRPAAVDTGTSIGAAISATAGCRTAALLTLLQPEPQRVSVTVSSADASLQDKLVLPAKLLAVDKPSGVPVHPSGGYQRNSLLHILEVEHEEYELRPVHRLDRMTSGVVCLGHSKVHI